MKKYIPFKTLIGLAGCIVFLDGAQAENLILSLSSSSYSIDSESLANNATASVVPVTSSGGVVWNGAFSEADTFYGPFSGTPVDLSSFTSLNIIMKLNGGVNPGATFTVGLANSNGDAAYFSGSTSGLSGLVETTLALTYTSGSFGLQDLTDVAGFQFTWDSDGSINGTIVAVEAIPEPATGSLILLGAAGFLALRRLRKV